MPFALIGVGLLVSTLIGPSIDSQQITLRLIAGLVFGGVGIGLIVMSMAGQNSARANQRLAGRNPDKPWLWREDWARGFAEMDGQSDAFTRLWMGILFCLVSAPMFLSISRELQRHNRLALIGFVFPLAGLLLIGQWVLYRARARKFRGTAFMLSKVPGVVGGSLAGRIETRFALPVEKQVEVTLSCVRSYVSGSGDSRSHWEKVLWQDKQSVQPALSRDGCYLPIQFAIPFDARETDMRNPDDLIFWRLSVDEQLSGANFRVRFLAPVFKTEESDSNQTIERLQQETVTHHPGTQPAGSKIRTSLSPEGGVQYYFRAGRNASTAAALAAFGIIFLGGGLFFGLMVGSSFSWVIGWIPLVFAGGIGLLVLALSLWLLMGATAVTIVNQELRVTSRFLGISHTSVTRASDIKRYDLYAGMQQGDKVWYDLRLHLNNGRHRTAGSGMEKPEAEWFLAEIENKLTGHA